MRRVIYASSSSFELTSAELDDIAHQAHERNVADHITGLLLYGDRSFFQVLEGPAAAVEDAKKRIWKDRRHAGISQLQDEHVDAAAFSEWSMGCYRIDPVQISSTVWTVTDFRSIEKLLPDETPQEILILARTFFNSITPSSMRIDQP